MKLTTGELDRAAFFLTFGAEMLDITGKYPNNVFTLSVSPLLAFYESVVGWVPYCSFCNMRKFIKRKTRTLAGLPEYFTGHTPLKVKLGDLAVVRSWRKGEAGYVEPRVNLTDTPVVS